MSPQPPEPVADKLLPRRHGLPSRGGLRKSLPNRPSVLKISTLPTLPLPNGALSDATPGPPSPDRRERELVVAEIREVAPEGNFFGRQS